MFQKLRGFNREIPLKCETSELNSNEGIVIIPTRPGSGVEIDPDFIAKHEVMKR
ncbi:MAG TPA: hypothetical protein P5210_12335 [Draconibacterium sp.]|nr:hypothetical protein [Draconibacterium sp.]HRX12436.1 hypothetical protein [Draconibacterium sp.]